MRDAFRDPRVALASTVALALALRVTGLGRDDLWSDEIHTLRALDAGALGIVRERLAAGHLPLYFLGLDLWADLFGTGAFALRLPSALLGALVPLPVHGLLRRVADRRTAVAGALLAALHPLLIELSREARMYPLLLLLLLVAAAAAAGVLRGERGGALIRLGAALALGPLVHASWGFGLMALAAFVALDPAGAPRRVRRRLLAALAASAAVLLLGLLGTVTQEPELARRPWPREVVVFILRLVAGSGVLDRWLPFYVALGGGWAAALFLGWRMTTPAARRLAIALVVAPILTCAAASVALHTALGPVRYVQLASVGLLLLAAAGTRRRWAAAALVALMLVGLGLRFVPPRTAWSDAARRLEAENAEEVTVPDAASRIQLEFYLGRPVRVGPPGAGAWRVEPDGEGGVIVREPGSR